jgi:hypothetical protein
MLASPAAANRDYNIVSRMKVSLFAVGCMPLLGASSVSEADVIDVGRQVHEERPIKTHQDI